MLWSSVALAGALVGGGLTAGQAAGQSLGLAAGQSLGLAADGAPSARSASSGSPARSGSFLGAVSCVGSSFCMGVGPDIAALLFTTPYSQVWDGAKWRTVPVPARSPHETGLFGISCTSAKSCVAVGGQDFEDGGQLSDAWNGTSWTRLPVPEKGSADALSGVDCTSASRCIAVGSGPNFATAQTWNGRSWTLTPRPVIPHGAELSEFNGIACTGPSHCLAVGDYATRKSKGLLALAESWNGHSWTRLAGLPAGFTALNGVACPSAKVCVAVGGGLKKNESDVASARWNGRSWTELTTPSPGGKDAGQALSSVSCPSVTHCIAVSSGPGLGPGGIGAGAFAEKWTGGPTWKLLSVPDPPGFDFDGAITAPADLAGVSCPRLNRCLAVGGDQDTDAISSYASFAVTWNGATWRVLRTGRVDVFRGVACAPRAYCLTTGAYLARNDATRGLTEIWNGTSLRLADRPGLAGVLSPVSCPAASFCMAAKGAGVAIWNGKRWVSSGPVGGSSYLSCTSPRFCMTIGFDGSSFTGESWNGKTWHSAKIATPKRSFPNFAFPDALSCATRKMCLAVGTLQAGNGRTIGPLAVAWNGSKWRVLRSPFEHKSSETLSAVSCRAATGCLTIGADQGRTRSTLFTARWNGRHWKVTKLSGHYPNAVWHGGPSSLSCPTATSCVAVGGHNRHTDLTLIWNGHSWRTANAGSPRGISEVSCASARQCVAAGVSVITTLVKFWNGRTWKLIKTINP